MKLSMNSKNCKFIVQPDKRKVICILDKTAYAFIDYMNRNIKFHLGGIWGDFKIEKKLIMPARFIGVATCALEDEFNEEIGRHIAFTRAKNKMNTSFFKRANLFIDMCDEQLDEAAYKLSQIGAKMSENADNRDKVIADMLGVESVRNGVPQDK